MNDRDRRSAAAVSYTHLDRQHGEDKIPLRHFHNELERLKHDDDASDHDEQPRTGQTAEGGFIRKCNIHGVRHLQKLDDS